MTHFSNDEEEPITRVIRSPILWWILRLVGATKILTNPLEWTFSHDMEDNLINMTAYTPAGDYNRAVVVDNNSRRDLERL